MSATPTYDEYDFYAWTQDQAARMRELAAEGADIPLDLENLAEAVESMGRKDAYALGAETIHLLEQLIRLAQPGPDTDLAATRQAIVAVRDRCRAIVQDSPSLAVRLREDGLDRHWSTARRAALAALGPAAGEAALPAACPYSVDQVLDPDWWPVPV